MSENFIRTEMLLGADKMEKLIENDKEIKTCSSGSCMLLTNVFMHSRDQA